MSSRIFHMKVWINYFSEKYHPLLERASTSRFGRGVIGSLRLKIASAGLTLLATIILVHTLVPANCGVCAYVYALVSLLLVPSEFGLPVLVISETARGMLHGDHAMTQGVWQWVGHVTANISLSLIALTGIVIWFFKEPLSGKQLQTFLWALAMVPLISLSDLCRAALRGLQQAVVGQSPGFPAPLCFSDDFDGRSCPIEV
jgi:O-antigen/teichoic acid export membrane protein